MTAKFIFLSALFLALNSCWKCPDKNLTFVPLAPSMEEYFGVYKPGNWWVYYNKARNKKDSVYVNDYTEDTLRDRTSCTESVQKTFKIKNTYLSGDEIWITYEAYELGTIFDLRSSTIIFSRFFYDKKEKKIISEPLLQNPGTNLTSTIMLNGVSYSDILFGKSDGVTYYFSKQKGLIGWGIAQDTFNLDHHRIL